MDVVPINDRYYPKINWCCPKVILYTVYFLLFKKCYYYNWNSNILSEKFSKLICVFCYNSRCPKIANEGLRKHSGLWKICQNPNEVKAVKFIRMVGKDHAIAFSTVQEKLKNSDINRPRLWRKSVTTPEHEISIFQDLKCPPILGDTLEIQKSSFWICTKDKYPEYF